jgi:hypothetical protein
MDYFGIVPWVIVEIVDEEEMPVERTFRPKLADDVSRWLCEYVSGKPGHVSWPE